MISCSTLPAAIKTYDEGDFELVVCDGSVNSQGDGVAWAEFLHSQGQRVVVVSGLANTHVPYVRKAFFDSKKVLQVLE